jgi:simple sugar transport system ATP-binding protein
MRRESRESLARIRLDASERTLVADLPVGHMQFVEIAREVDKGEVRVLVFDEPTAVLTESEAETLLGVMRDLAGRGIAILFITHRLDEVMSVADTVTILRDGELVSCTRKDDTSISEIAERMVGRDVSSDARTGAGGAADTGAEAILRVEALRVSMPGEEVRGVDFAVAPGEIFGIGGLAGHGKIGIANGIMGLAAATGRVTVAGQELRLNSPKTALAQGLAFVSEDRRGVGLLLDESLEMNIAVPAIEVRRQFLSAAFLGPFARVDRAAVRRHARQAIADLDIRTTGPKQVVRRLSGGNQQKVCLARALVLEPRILLVSEPTRGIDVGAKELILDRLRKLNRERGLTILMTSSELGELRSLCHRIAIVSAGRIAGILAPDDPDVAYGLLMSGGPR